MATIQYEVPNNVQRMTIGVQGEDNVREFLFDITEWRALTGDIGTAEMVVQRNGDASPYAAVITMHDENTVSWIPTSIDTEKVGAGKLQLMWFTNDQIVKTKIFDMKVDPALDYKVPDTSLDPWKSWVSSTINAAAKLKVISEEVSDIKKSMTSPYNFMGALDTENDLPDATPDNKNDTYYLINRKYRVTSNGTSWEQSSMDESDYTDELALEGAKITALEDELLEVQDALKSPLPWSVGNVETAINYQNGGNISNSLCKTTSNVFVSNYDYILYSRCISTAKTSVNGMAFYAAGSHNTYISGIASLGGGAELGYKWHLAKVPENAQVAEFTMWANVDGFAVYGISVYKDRGLISDLGLTSLTQCVKPGIYRCGSSYQSSITDLPDDFPIGTEAFDLRVTTPSLGSQAWGTQELSVASGLSWTRVMHYRNYQWSMDAASNMWQNPLKTLEDTIVSPISWAIGTQNSRVDPTDGRMHSYTGTSVTRFIDVRGYKYLRYARTVEKGYSPVIGMAFYRGKQSKYDGISGIPSRGGGGSNGYTPAIIPVPAGAKYALFTVWNDAIENFYVYGYKNKCCLDGLKLSVLGDSISSIAGYIPEGNDAYYSGANHGVNGVDQMWWQILCNATGMKPLVIDAWSGSSICYNFSTDQSHSDTVKIPMCSDLRTSRLGANGITPDVIIIAGGTNDWTYAEDSTTPLGDWNGRTAVDEDAVTSGNSTFMESYASMVNKLQTNYPNAVVVCASCFFTGRGQNLGITHINDVGLTEADYNNAIKKVCEIMGVPYIDIYNVGFSNHNYYPNYAPDSQSIPTHPNADGQLVVAKRFIAKVPDAVQQFALLASTN